MHDNHDDDDAQRNQVGEAIASYYARQQEGLPPPLPNTSHLRAPHQRWLALRRTGATRLSFTAYLQQEGIAVPEWFVPEPSPPADPAAPVQPTLPGLPPAP